MTILFIILVIILWILAILFFSFTLLRLYGNKHKRLVRQTGRVLHRLAHDDDYLLLKDIQITTQDHVKLKADYFLIADKYCYLIICKYLNGVSLEGGLNDGTWVLTSKDGKNTPIRNLINNNDRRTEVFENWLKNGKNLNERIVLPVLVIDDDLALEADLVGDHNGRYLFRRKYLRKGLESIEKSSNLPDLSLEAIHEVFEKVKPYTSLESKR